MGKFGYIGARPTQSSSSSSGVFSVNDVANLLDQSLYPLQSVDVSYLVIAGGGGGAGDRGQPPIQVHTIARRVGGLGCSCEA